MRFRTAAILAAVLIGGMFCLPHVAFAVFPSLKGGARIPVLFDVVLFCIDFRWFLSLAIVPVLFTIAAFTANSRPRV